MLHRWLEPALLDSENRVTGKVWIVGLYDLEIPRAARLVDNAGNFCITGRMSV